jgi:glycine dehydrogenase subunit 1
MYDCGTSLAEACMMAHAHNKRSEIVYAGTVNPNYRNVVSGVTQGKKLTFKSAVSADGTCDLKALEEIVTDATSAVVIQTPNGYGTLEDVKAIEKIAHDKKCLFIVVTDMISLGILQAPGEYAADVVVAEGQTLGIPVSFGGPYLGIFAVKKALVRKMPGRVCGITQDTTGERGFVLTLQTREQHIKREHATSNICSNQGLMMLAATVYMATMGKRGIRETAELCLQKAHYCAESIKKIPGFKINADGKPFFSEFLVETPVPASEIISAGIKEGILAGIDTARFDDCKKGLLVAVTEKRSKAEIDKLVSFLKKFAK